MGILSRKYGDFCAPFAGAAFTLAFSPFDQYYLAHAALIFLIVSTVNLSPPRAFLRGYLFGLGTFGLGVSWVFISLHDAGGASIWVSVLLTSLFVAFWAFYPALAVFIGATMPIKSETGRLLLFPLVWILVEYVRGTIVLNGFPWLQVAYSQLDTPLAGYIPVVGSYGTGLVTLVMTSLLIVLFKNKKRAFILTAVIVLLWGGGFFLRTVTWTHPIGSPIKATLIQGNIAQDKKWLPEYRLKTLHLYRSLTERHWNSKVIVWPETSIPAYLDEVRDDFIDPLSNEAKR
ncbi:MAG: apolipoprotein N-acyltransferase, partial [Gammaproteobacteria bacterium]